MTTSAWLPDCCRRVICATFWAILIASGSLSRAHAGETITFFHNDVAGSPAVATDVNGLTAWKETYRPYGDQLIDSSAAQNNKLWFAGKSFDDSTGLSYMGARYYDPTLGRFMAVDPVSFNLDNLHSFNRYTYANNNPYRFVDPDGREAATAQWLQQTNAFTDRMTANLTKGEAAVLLAGHLGMLAGPVAVDAVIGLFANPATLTEVTIAAAETAAGDALGGATLAAGTAMVAAADDVAEGVGNLIWRGGGRNPGNLTVRDGETALSFRDSLSNPMPQDAPAVFKPGREYIGVDPAKLPPNSVVHDGGTNGLPPGHVSVTAPVERIQEAIVEKGRFPK